MGNFFNSKSVDGFSVKLWRGERMVLIGMDVDQPEDDLVGFSIEVQSPSNNEFLPLRNRISFSYDKHISPGVNGFRNYPSTQAPFQKFRWIHFPYNPTSGNYTYRVTKQHMLADGSLKSGTAITLDISLDTVVYDGYLDVGFTRNYASSQAYVDKYKNNMKIIPATAAKSLSFKKVPGDVYEWLGFEAYQLIFDFLKDAVEDGTIQLDVFAYDLNEPDIVGLLEKMGNRLRIVIDNSGNHASSTSAESIAAGRFRASAGKDHVVRMRFSGLQHNKVLIAKRNNQPIKVLHGSTNFSFRGLYIQANNVLVFRDPKAAALFEDVFELAIEGGQTFSSNLIATQWHLLQVSSKPPVHFCFSPHKDANLSLGPIGSAIDQATSSVLFCLAFLNQAKTGPVREAIDRLEDKNIFSYGISDKAGGLNVNKPDGSIGIVDFEHLAKYAPMPFKTEWSGAGGIHEHHKFVVTDFNLPTAKVFTGSSNQSMSGEAKNGDNLVMIEDQRVATSYAIEALRIFDHLHFRSVMQAATDAGHAPTAITLAKPTAISGQPAWFEKFYVANTEAQKDRLLFSH